MKIIHALVYTSNAGHTARYAKLLQEKTGIPAYCLEEAKEKLSQGAAVVYMGWLMAASVKDYKKAAKLFSVQALCGVGLCDTGTAIPQVRKANKVPESMPVFTLQGGMERKLLIRPYVIAIDILTKAMASKKNRSADEERMLQLLQTDGDMVDAANLGQLLSWLEE